MTLGERIANKRKTAGLSQEELGNIIGVSRQSIYKWENDQAVPELDKLVQLGKLFEVSVDWLVNEGSAESSEARQEDMQSEDAADKGGNAPKREGKAKNVFFCAVIVLLLIALVTNGLRLRKLEDRYNELRTSIDYLYSHTDSVISSVVGSVYAALDRYTDLMVSNDVKLENVDFEHNIITFSVSAQPKTFVKGMTAAVLVTSGTEKYSFPAEASEDRSFTATVSFPLSDEIEIAMEMINGKESELAVLQSYQGLYTGSFGFYNILWELPIAADKNGVLEQYCEVMHYTKDSLMYIDPDGRFPIPKVGTMSISLLQDGKEIAVYEKLDGIPQNMILHGDPNPDAEKYFFERPQGLKLESGHYYEEVLTVTDVYGRSVQFSSCYQNM